MAVRIFVHGSGHKAASWDKTISHLTNQEDILCPELSSILQGKEASYENLYASFAKYCSQVQGQLHLCGLSLGGILALNYALDYPEKVITLVLIGTPYQIPKAAFGFQNLIFKLLPKSAFESMAFDKNGTFALMNSLKNLDFSVRAGKVTCPVLILCGQKDSANRKSADFFLQNMKNASLKIIENAGHVVNEENPKALAEILDEFYSKRQVAADNSHGGSL